MSQLIDQISNSGLFAQSAYSAGIATCDSNGNDITATYLTGVDLTPYQTISGMADYQTTAGMSAYATTAWVSNINTAIRSDMETITTNTSNNYNAITSTSSFLSGAIDNKLNTTAFSDVSGTFLTAIDLSNYYTKSETSGATELADAFANIPAGDPDVNSYVQTNSGSINQTVSTYQSNSGNYLTAIDIPESANWNDVYNTVNVYSGSWTGSESSPTASVDSNGSIDIVSSNNTVYFDVNGTWFNNAVNSAVDIPTGVMVESACEYNAVNEISGYNGSAIAQYGADKQWLQHDDTIVHVANSAQYAFGCNVSALQRLMGIDETVLWEGSVNTTATSGTLSESIENFNMTKVFTRVVNSTDRANIITTVEPRFGNSNYTLMYFPNYSIGGGTTTENTMYLQVFSDKTFKLLAGSKWSNGTYTQSVTAYDFAITKIVGIGRKS